MPPRLRSQVNELFTESHSAAGSRNILSIMREDVEKRSIDGQGWERNVTVFALILLSVGCSVRGLGEVGLIVGTILVAQSWS